MTNWSSFSDTSRAGSKKHKKKIKITEVGDYEVKGCIGSDSKWMMVGDTVGHAQYGDCVLAHIGGVVGARECTVRALNRRPQCFIIVRATELTHKSRRVYQNGAAGDGGWEGCDD